MHKALTLIEIIVVITIIGILAMVALPNITKSKVVANESAAQANLKVISAAIENYLATRDAYPSAESDLTGANPPYLSKNYCNKIDQGYNYSCSFSTTAYTITAEPTSCRQTGGYDFSITNGGNLTSSGC